jgi:hypothetical protein
MNTMMITSLILNIVILIPVCLGLITDAKWANTVYGEASPARAILTSVYAAILLVSCVFLIWKDPTAVAALLIVQIVYKVISLATVGSLAHPVVMTNLLVATFHAATLATYWTFAPR